MKKEVIKDSDKLVHLKDLDFDKNIYAFKEDGNIMRIMICGSSKEIFIDNLLANNFTGNSNVIKSTPAAYMKNSKHKVYEFSDPKSFAKWILEKE